MKIKNVKVYGLEESCVRSGLPMIVGEIKDMHGIADNINNVHSEEYWKNNVKRANKLAKVPSGSGHDNFMKGIIVQFDLQYPEYFSPQLQRYNWIDIISSQSKMHKITSRKLTKDDFTEDTELGIINIINAKVHHYNTTTKSENKPKIFKQIISNLPSGYLKWMGISTNYLQLKTIWNQRCKHGHKLDEWRIFREFIQGLLMSELITGKDGK